VIMAEVLCNRAQSDASPKKIIRLRHSSYWGLRNLSAYKFKFGRTRRQSIDVNTFAHEYRNPACDHELDRYGQQVFTSPRCQYGSSSPPIGGGAIGAGAGFGAAFFLGGDFLGAAFFLKACFLISFFLVAFFFERFSMIFFRFFTISLAPSNI
jgi:hypothetical protein